MIGHVLDANWHFYPAADRLPFSLIHLQRLLTLIPVESAAWVQPEAYKSTIGRWTWHMHPRCRVAYNQTPGA